MNTPASRSSQRCAALGRNIIGALIVGWLPTLSAIAQQPDSLAPFSYQNRLYSPSPDPIPGLTGSPQPKGVAIFGGNVGAAGVQTTPNNGASYYLVQSGFGQPAGEPRHADFLLGQEIIPDPALQVDLTKTPGINPPVKAFYLADVQKVFANEAGL